MPSSVLTAEIAETSEALLVLEAATRRRDLQGHSLQKRRGNPRDGKTTQSQGKKQRVGVETISSTLQSQKTVPVILKWQ